MNVDDDSEISTQSNFKMPSNITPEDINQKSIELVRLALSNNISDTPLKKEEIKKKVIKDNMKIFPLVFDKAQKTLRTVYSMELVEYPTRGSAIHSLNKSNDSETPATQATQSSQASTSSQTSAKKSSSKKYSTNSYILRNIIPGNLRRGLTFNKKDYQWHGFIIIVLCLVYVNSNHIREDLLYKYLKKLGLEKNVKHNIFGDIEKSISQLIQKGYLEKEKSNISNEEVIFTYRWGSRALVEFPEKNLIKFITKFYEDSEKDQITRELVRSRGIN
ncbi:MAGE-domain-containing protein [Neocallimastix lanati (nom. inval.)]|jgi:hypothetical protein|uniref:MAGE-domain-containing protein n=1 Tax=Neocallimastix californiae TaxID=1754190 RepID=A0A1Y2FRB1_9FUNG|nr:MAGE-domain-containing protein [Neocallimastix sp. JGI-2020a]ORY85255.1 MAGE-domain-containing protein [Neocallimastix californiae]|eukprot:ORY85255.1 MAGE-domain-containing protein [Neocallimastix californiae]